MQYRSRPVNRPLLVVDGDSFAHRAYHALPKSIRRSGNRDGGAIVGFANLLLRLYDSERPRAVLVGWDTLGAPTFRQRLFPPYQSGRQFDEELIDQLEVLPRLLSAAGFANAKAPSYEADDFLAAAVAEEERRDGTVLVASGDCDAFQLASAVTTVLHPLKAGEMARIGPAEVLDRYGVEPRQVPDFIALRGDPSDRLPGARGVGAKGAATLLQRYGTLERIIAEGRLTEQADALKLYKRLATMDATAPLPALGDQTSDWAQAAALARKWELNQLALRFEVRSVSFSRSSATSRSTSAATPPRKVAARGGPQQFLKIATFNVNNVNRRLASLLAWIGRSKPGVVCELLTTLDTSASAA
jgi:DNA polymerase I